MRKNPMNIFQRFGVPAVIVSIVLGACQLTQNGKTEDTASFTKLYDTLSRFDSTVIIFKNMNGTVLDTVYQGKVDTLGEIQNLPVDNWDGGKVVIVIEGYQDGKQVYEVEKVFDGATNTSDTTFVIITQGTTLSVLTTEVLLVEGDSIPKPAVTVTPASLKDKSLNWTSSQPGVVSVGATHLKALAAGTAQVTVALVSDTSKKIVLRVSVSSDSKKPDSINLSPKELRLAADGAPARITVKAFPANASNAVAWRSQDSTLASVSADGLVQGHKKGVVKVYAHSKEKPSLSDSATITVTDPVPVERIRFVRNPVGLFVGGPAESLMVEATPPEANPAADFTVLDPAIVSLLNGKITAIAVGQTLVIAKSRQNPAKADTLRVTVLKGNAVDSVRITPRVPPTIFTGGTPLALTANVYPADAPTLVQWRSANPAIATVDTGTVKAVSPGKIRIHLVSQADSLKKDSVEVTVKRDVPKVSIGQDTTVSLGQTVSFLPVVAPQEYGAVTQFKYDLDGDLIWDDSSTVVKAVSYKYDLEKEYTVRFYVRDTELNDTIVSKKVKAVKGPVVIIQSPLNNSYTNQASVDVKWTVDDVVQDSLKRSPLVEGKNTLTRTYRDASGTPFTASITVYLDVTPPGKPLVHGPALAATKTPTWTWASGGAGGNGSYRAGLEIETLAAAPETKDTTFKPAAELSEGPHALYVQERDEAGNWSASGTLSITIDVTGPGKPDVRVSTGPVTTVRKPTWIWKGTGGGSGSFQYIVDNGEFTSGATATTDTTYTPANNLSGPHTVYVREKDAAGNWSAIGSAQVTIDTIAPNAPKLTGTSPTGNAPKWSWTSGGAGGSGNFRHKLGAGADLSTGATETKDTTYVLAGAVSGTTYTLNVQERDSAGSWSATASLAIKYDLTKPTVTISSPQASGTYFTAAATVALSGTSTGPNTVSKVAYSVDGGASVNAVLGTAGAWSVASVALATEKTYVITVTATDALGNTGEAALSVVKDNTPPTAPVALSAPTTPTNVNKASWTWAAGSDGVAGSGLNGQYRHNINGGSWITTATAAASNISLVEGKNTFSVQEQDKAGNWSPSATNDVVLDTKVPDAVTFIGTDGSYTTSQMPTWTWTPSTTNGGIGTYVLKLNAEAEFDLSATTYTPTKVLPDNQTHTLTVKQRDQVAGAVGTAKSFSFKVKVNPPGAPNVKSAASGVVNNGSTNNPKFTWTTGGGGKNVYRVRINSNTAYETHPQTGGTQTDWTLPSNSADGTYTIRVSEQDDAGTWGAEGTFTIKLDRTGPSFTEITVTGGGFALREGFITNKASIGISFKADGTAKDTTCNLAADNNTNACKISAKDALGNQATLTRNVWRRSKVIFVKEDGTGNGSSWEEASSDLAGVLGNETNNGKEIWAASGNYAGAWMYSMTLLGGFDASTFPTASSGRSKTNTFVDGVVVDFSGGGVIDGFTFTGPLRVRITTLTITDCRLQTSNSLISVTDGASLIANNINITGVTGFTALIDISSGSAVFNGGSIVNNKPDADRYSIYVSGDVIFKGGINVYGNSLPVSPYQVLLHAGASLTVESGVNFDCTEVANEGGSLDCKN